MHTEIKSNVFFYFRYVILRDQCIKFSIFDWTRAESNDPYEQEPLGTCEATLAEIVARGGESQVHALLNAMEQNILNSTSKIDQQ